MIRRGLDPRVGVRVIDFAAPSSIEGAGDQVPQVAENAIGEKPLTPVVEIKAPGIDRAMRDNFERAALGMKAPNAARNLGALFLSVIGLMVVIIGIFLS